MAVTLNHSNGKGATSTVTLEANEAVERTRFRISSVQTTGDVYVSNRRFPALELTSADWAKVTEAAFGNIYVVDMPVRWIVATAEASVVSHVSGDM